jgi:hypothetical protein
MHNDKRDYQSQRFKRPSGARKPLTNYSVGLAFQRIEFYLDVIEAHFAKLGVEVGYARGTRVNFRDDKPKFLRDDGKAPEAGK